jgi:Xaa-Pro aminopeptidase
MNENKTLFGADFFVKNRRTLREQVKARGPIVVTANGLLQRGADSGFAFAQDANFWYLTGVDDPDVTLVIDESDEFLIVTARDASRETFDGSVDSKKLERLSGITKIVDEVSGWKRLDMLLTKSHRVATPAAAPNYLQHYGMYVNPSRARLIERMQKHVDNVELVDIRTELANMRMIKQMPELAALQAAIDITSATLNEVTAKEALEAYRYEYEVEADIFRGFRKRGARGHSFEPIVAGGKNACTLHNVANNDALRTGDLLICDVGAEVEHYAADITRTVALGAPTKRQEDVFTAVLEVQTYALSLMKPGVLLAEFEDEVAKRMGEELQKLALITSQDSSEIRKYFPHATSHFLGINVHDVGDYTKPLQPGVVITCEPGIYVPEEGIGVRIEDDVLITAKGNEVLSAACRKELV